jgi:hypothetical protein
MMLMMVGTAFGAEPPPVKLFATSIQLRPPEAAKTDFALDISSAARQKPVETLVQKYQAMNGKGPLDSTPRIEPNPLTKVLNLFSAPGGSFLGGNPNAPPNRFTK